MGVGHRTVIDTVDLHPVVRGDAMVGVKGAILGDPSDPTMLVTRLVLLVRPGTGGSAALLDGRSRFAGFDLGLSPGGSASPVAGARLDLVRLDIQHDGAGGLRFDERPFVVMRDDAFVHLGNWPRDARKHRTN